MWTKNVERAIGWVVLRGALVAVACVGYVMIQDWVGQELQGGKK